MYLVGNADEWWGHYWKAFVTGKDKNRINISHRQLLLKITACSLSQKLGGTMELSYGNRKDQYDKTRLLLCARFLRVRFPSLHHTLLLPLQDQEKGSLRGSKGPCTHSSPLGSPKQGSWGECWLLLPESGIQGFYQRHLWLQAASGMCNAQAPSHITPLHQGHV